MRRWFRLILICAAACLSASCGGGVSSDGNKGSSGTIQADGKFTLMFSGGSIPGVKHAWLTVYKFAVNEDANKPWDPADSSWKVRSLSAPKTIDITSTTGFVFGTVTEGLALPPGEYKQIRLFFKAPEDTTSPFAMDADNHQLTYKAQLQYDDGTIVPIEIPNIYTGLKLDRGVTVKSSQAALLVATFDAAHSIVRFDSGGAADAVTLRPRTYTYAVNPVHTAQFIGGLDPSLVCGTEASNYAVSNCASDITVSLFAASGDLQRMESYGTVKVNPVLVDGKDDVSFLTGIVTYVPYLKEDGTPEKNDDGSIKADNPIQYDLLIKGRGMRTMLVRNIPVELANANIGCSWSVGSGTNAGSVKALIRPVLDAAPQTNVTLSAPLAFKAGKVGLGFELGGRYYEAYSTHTDPFSDNLTAGARLTIPGAANANMSIEVVNYAAITAYCQSVTTASASVSYFVPFTSQAVSSYRPFAIDTFYTDAKVATSHDYSGGASFDVERPTEVPGLTPGTVSVSISGLPSTGYNKASLVVSDVGGIVSTQDISSMFPSGSTTVSLPAVPSGITTNGDATGVYEFAVRYWNSSTPNAMKWARSSSFVNLRNGVTSGAVAITVPSQ